MSISVKNSNNEWVQCAGQGRAEYGASTVRTGTFTNPALAENDSSYITVTFSSPMPDNDYVIQCYSPSGANVLVEPSTSKTVNGFTVKMLRIGSAISADTWTFTYTAFKLYTDTEYNQVLDALPPVDAVTDGNMKAVTSNAVYDAMNVIQSGTGTRNASYVSSDSFYCAWFKVGRICTVNIQFNLFQSTSSNEEIITGLPKPVTEIASVGEGSSNTSVSSFVIRTNGTVRTHYPAESGQFVHGTATYITAD